MQARRQLRRPSMLADGRTGTMGKRREWVKLYHIYKWFDLFAYSLPSPFSAPAVRAIGRCDLRTGER